MLFGKITVEEAREEAEPVINEMNVRGEEVAKRFGKKYRPLTFAYLMR